jgi:hypothetical protein
LGFVKTANQKLLIKGAVSKITGFPALAPVPKFPFGKGAGIIYAREPVALVDFCAKARKGRAGQKIPVDGASLESQGIKIHFRDFLYGFMRETHKTDIS